MSLEESSKVTRMIILGPKPTRTHKKTSYDGTSTYNKINMLRCSC
jgi:hypothetical protein